MTELPGRGGGRPVGLCGGDSAAYELAGEVIALARAAGITLGCAESVTGGLVAAALTDVPGASIVLRGGVVSYATAVKARVLGVPAGLLAACGAVDPDVARAMAAGAARVLDADLAVATTGVAGPDPADGKPVGRVYVAVNRAVPVRELDLPGDRWQVRAAATTAALESLRDTLARC